jgi:hypothetical protein
MSRTIKPTPSAVGPAHGLICQNPPLSTPLPANSTMMERACRQRALTPTRADRVSVRGRKARVGPKVSPVVRSFADWSRRPRFVRCALRQKRFHHIGAVFLSRLTG